MGQILPPDDSIIVAADLPDEAISEYYRRFPGPVGKFEAGVEASLLVTLIIRHTEGVTELARGDLVLIPAGMVLGRAAFEAAIRALWLLQPDDPHEREVRWLAHYRDGERFYTAQSVATSDLTEAIQARDIAGRLRDFRLGVERAFDSLPTPYAQLTRLPSLRDMVGSLSMPEAYMRYRTFSQYVHATYVASDLYRRSLGAAQRVHEAAEPHRYWREILRPYGSACGKQEARSSSDSANRMVRSPPRDLMFGSLSPFAAFGGMNRVACETID